MKEFNSVSVLCLTAFVSLLEVEVGSRGVQGLSLTNTTQVADLSVTIFAVHDDLLETLNVFFSTAAGLASLDLATAQTFPVAGTLINSTGYNDGPLLEARFNQIRSFVQPCTRLVVLVDSLNHCIRSVDRAANLTSTFAGKCREEGSADGPLGQSRFTLPLDIVYSISGRYYISDSVGIRVIDSQTGDVITLTTSDGSHARLAISSDGYLYFLTKSSLQRMNLTTYHTVSVTATHNMSEVFSWRPGEEMIDTGNDIVLLSNDILVGSSQSANALWAYSLTSSNFSLLCTKGQDNCSFFQPGALAVSAGSQSLLVISGTVINRLPISGLNWTSLTPNVNESCKLVKPGASSPLLLTRKYIPRTQPQTAPTKAVRTESTETFSTSPLTSRLYSDQPSKTTAFLSSFAPNITKTTDNVSTAKAVSNRSSTLPPTTVSLATQTNTTRSMPLTQEGLTPQTTSLTKLTAAYINITTANVTTSSTTAGNETASPGVLFGGLTPEMLIGIAAAGIVVIMALVFLLVFRRKVRECCCRNPYAVNGELIARRNLYQTGTLISNPPEHYDHMLNNNAESGGHGEGGYTRIPLTENVSTFKPMTEDLPKPPPSIEHTDGTDYICINTGERAPLANDGNLDS